MLSIKNASLIAVLCLLITSGIATAGPNADAVLSLDLIADGGAGNQRDDGATTGVVSGQGTTVAAEVFARGVRTSLRGIIIKFNFDASLIAFIGAENSAFALSVPEASVGVNLAATSPVTLPPSGFLARAEFETVADVTGREFSIGIETVTLAENVTSQDELKTTATIMFNSTPSPDFDGDGTVGFSDFVLFARNFGTQVGDATYDARFDLDVDGSVGFSDFVVFARQFGQFVVRDNQQPVTVGAIAAQTLTAGGDDATVDLSDSFSDPDDDPLKYSASSSDTSVAAVLVTDNMLTIAPKEAGSATVTVTATDPGGSSVEQTIDVTVRESGGGGASQRCTAGLMLRPGDSCQGSGYSFRNEAGVLIGQGSVGGISIDNARFGGGSVRLNQLHLTKSGNVWTIVSLP